MKEKRPIKRIKRRKQLNYSESFKYQVCQMVSSGELTVTQAIEKYDTRSQSGISRWMKQYGFTKKEYNPIGVDVIIKMPDKVLTKEELTLKVKELEKSLDDALLKAEVHSKIIEIASKELGIDIEKKFNTKQLKK